MKRNRALPLLVLVGSALTVAPAARAQSVGQALGQALGQFLAPQNESTSMDQLRSFDHFMQDHPEIARDLRQRPGLVNDRGYVDNHPPLRDWLSGHPDAAAAFRENPDGFIERERHFQQYNSDFSSGDTRRGELAHFDYFLDSHSEIRNDLMRHPDLALSDRYLSDHSDLRAFLDRHPMVRDDLRNDARGFMDRESRLENAQYESR
jgi:hypothetical protein